MPVILSAEDELRQAYGTVIAAILDNHPESPARQRAIELVIASHATVTRTLATPTIGGIAATWLSTKLH
jgi:hypothetical protein